MHGILWPCPPLGDLPDSGMEPDSLMSPALAGSLSLAPPGKSTEINGKLKMSQEIITWENIHMKIEFLDTKL